MFFSKGKRPVVTVMLKARTKENLIDEIKRAMSQGADAFGFQAEGFDRAFRSYDNLKEIFS